MRVANAKNGTKGTIVFFAMRDGKMASIAERKSAMKKLGNPSSAAIVPATMTSALPKASFLAMKLESNPSRYRANAAMTACITASIYWGCITAITSANILTESGTAKYLKSIMVSANRAINDANTNGRYHTSPNFKNNTTNSSPDISSMMGYCLDMGSLQKPHLPPRAIHENIGIL